MLRTFNSRLQCAEAVRQVGAEEKVQVVDLNAMSLKLYAALGAEKSTRLFVHYPAKTYPAQVTQPGPSRPPRVMEIHS